MPDAYREAGGRARRAALIAPLPLAELIETEGETYASLSRMLGRPDGYLADRARRGTLNRLPADELAALQRYFGRPIAEALESSGASAQTM
ncbi:hypothetical protein [Sphingomonas sanxanigenens]|uniref:hypothetical protein n=1 Tax=Sphingomonas sanxanigenens TaxID=397260 RepID=UPI00138F8909|nr:hypothetical protein [Sphingomonas sanxanigenens]